jgi:hypothetical protein
MSDHDDIPLAYLPSKPRDVPTAEQGRNLPWVFGEWLFRDPNVSWWGHLKTTPVKRKSGK